LAIADVLREQSRGALLVDTRDAERFAEFHLRGAIQLSLQGSFASWAAILIHPTHPLVLLTADVRHAREAHARLARVGLERVIGYSLADERQWREERANIATIPVYRCANLRDILNTDSSVQLVDVRSPSEWRKGHLPGAISLPLMDLDSLKRSVDPCRTSLVYCQEGYRATTAASMLLRAGVDRLGILIDGVEGWSASGRPLEVSPVPQPTR
jgi:rhodanese-related sulfurtransferase